MCWKVHVGCWKNSYLVLVFPGVEIPLERAIPLLEYFWSLSSQQNTPVTVWTGGFIAGGHSKLSGSQVTLIIKDVAHLCELGGHVDSLERRQWWVEGIRPLMDRDWLTWWLWARTGGWGRQLPVSYNFYRRSSSMILPELLRLWLLPHSLWFLHHSARKMVRLVEWSLASPPEALLPTCKCKQIFRGQERAKCMGD